MQSEQEVRRADKQIAKPSNKVLGKPIKALISTNYTMGDLFPLGAGMGRITGTLIVLKRHSGAMELSELADEVEEEIDDLLPVIEACKLLKFVAIKGPMVKLTPLGTEVTVGNSRRMIREALPKLEPFRTALQVIDSSEITSDELLKDLHSRRIVIHGDRATNDALLKKMLIRLGVRSKLLRYSPSTDTWSKRS